MSQPSITKAAYEPDRLFAGHFPRVSNIVIISSGQVLTRGAVLGKVTVSGEYVLSASGAANGSETPVAILAEDVDATAGDTPGTVYLSGEFAEEELTLGTGHTLATIRDGLRALGIYLKATQAP